jgi:miniconductance mechanosensitive channel
MMMLNKIMLNIYHVICDFIEMVFSFHICKCLGLIGGGYFLFFYFKNIAYSLFRRVKISVAVIKSGKISCYYILSSLYLIAALFCFTLLSKALLYKYPLLVIFLCKLYHAIFILFVLRFVISIVDIILKISNNINKHKSIAIISFFQLFKILAVAFSIICIVSILFNMRFATVFTSLGTVTAIIVLIFRDTILGFVSGFQIASGKIVKKGDWVSMPKHAIEGTISEINLFSSKIENFDKSISNIPTSDIVSSLVVNFEFMTLKNIRRIKYFMLFDITKFKFYTGIEIDNILNKFYFTSKVIEYLNCKSNNMYRLNSANDYTNITNIMLFKYYIISYLNKHPDIVKKEVILVHNLPMVTNGLPVEIYCFVNTENWINYSIIKSNIFDYLITISKEFDLLIIQKR